MQVGDLQRDVFLGLQRGDAGEFRLQRLQAGGFDAAFVHAGGPIVADLLLHGAALGIVVAGGFQSFAQQVFIPEFRPLPVLQKTWSAGIGLAVATCCRNTCRSRCRGRGICRPGPDRNARAWERWLDRLDPQPAGRRYAGGFGRCSGRRCLGHGVGKRKSRGNAQGENRSRKPGNRHIASFHEFHSMVDRIASRSYANPVRMQVPYERAGSGTLWPTEHHTTDGQRAGEVSGKAAGTQFEGRSG